MCAKKGAPPESAVFGFGGARCVCKCVVAGMCEGDVSHTQGVVLRPQDPEGVAQLVSTVYHDPLK